MSSRFKLLRKKNNLIDKESIEEGESIACILAYYNGTKYIQEQIQSIIDQDIENFTLSIFISDDNSEKHFPSIKALTFNNAKSINIFYRKLDKNIGYAKNFLFSLRSIIKEYDYYCFSDQDDIWGKNKIEKAIKIIKKNQSNKPYLYFSRTAYFNENCTNEIGRSNLYKNNPSFKNALVQNMAGGNTMIFNNNAKYIISKSIKDMNFISHDWWCYLIISGSGGNIYYDSDPSIKYRQHKNNFLGSNNKIQDRIKRIKGLFHNQLKDCNELHIKALKDNEYLLTKENRLILENFSILRKQSFLKRIFLFYKSGIHRKTIIGNMGLFLAIVLKKF